MTVSILQVDDGWFEMRFNGLFLGYYTSREQAEIVAEAMLENFKTLSVRSVKEHIADAKRDFETDVAWALKENAGSIKGAAKTLNASRSTIQDWINCSPFLQRVKADIQRQLAEVLA